jgi:beta-xylosidase
VHFQDRRAYGRSVHLQPVKWINDWPVIGVDADGDGKGEPVIRYRKPNVGREYPVQMPQTSDEFGSTTLGFQWQWHANPLDSWLSVSTRPGWLRLNAVSRPAGAQNLWSVPNLLLQKLPAHDFRVTTLVDVSRLKIGERSGLLMMGRDYSYLAVEKTSTGVRIVRVICLDAPKGAAEKDVFVEVKSPLVYLRVSVVGEAICNFSFSTDGKRFQSVGDIFVAAPGMWIGAKLGLFALAPVNAVTEGYADYYWFRF